jgi:DNA-binding GntR family transcriptional regulator
MSLTEDAPELVRTTVYRRLRADILSCALRPGSQIQERQLVDRFSVSKSPIRDALLKLEEQNLIEVLPRKGYRVKPISIADARELYEMRLILERECVSRVVDFADESSLAALNVYRTMPAPEVELADWIEYNRSFHAAIADASGNLRLAHTTRNVIEQFDRFTYTSVAQSGPQGRARFGAEHIALIDAIQKRDKRQALAVARDHVEASRRRVLESLENPIIVP